MDLITVVVYTVSDALLISIGHKEHLAIYDWR